MNTVHPLVTAAVAAAIGLTGCSNPDGRAAPAAPAVRASVAVQSPLSSAADAGSALPDVDVEVDKHADVAPELAGLTRDAIRHLPADPEPVGPTATVALTFMQKLRTGDWLNAARQLTLYGRDRLSYLEPASVEAVMRDVLQRAGDSTLGVCTTSRRLHRDAAVVQCGDVDVVVHTSTFPWRGVQISSEHPDDDVLATPHTHAYTTRLQ